MAVDMKIQQKQFVSWFSAINQVSAAAKQTSCFAVNGLMLQKSYEPASYIATCYSAADSHVT